MGPDQGIDLFFIYILGCLLPLSTVPVTTDLLHYEVFPWTLENLCSLQVDLFGAGNFAKPLFVSLFPNYWSKVADALSLDWST